MKLIKLENIDNVRDLGGTKTKDGRTVKYGKLIRGSSINPASKNDIKTLNKLNIRHVHDFRTPREAEEKPHPKKKLSHIKYHQTPVVNEMKTVLARDKKNRSLTAKAAQTLSVEDAMRDMKFFYDKIPSLDEAQFAYKTLFDVLLNNEHGAVYWHCSMGKDRCGIGTLLVLHALDVPQETIIADYLSSNIYLKENVNRVMDSIDQIFPFKINYNAFMMFQIAHEDYINTTLNRINKDYNSLDSYIEKTLGVTPKQQEILKDKYLE